jgi:hypothetical protein
MAMKSFLLSTVLSLCIFSVFAQRSAYELKKFESPSHTKAPMDTLWPGNADNAASFVLIADSNGGYVLGTNSYHTIACGQQFKVTTSYKITGAIVWLGSKKVITDDTLTFAVWRMDSVNGYTLAGSDQPAPGTLLTSYTTTLSQVDTASLLDNAYFLTFDQPIIVIDDYLMGIDYSKFTTDTLGLVSSANGEGNGGELVWEKWGLNDTWHTIQASGWGYPALLDIDAMILPVIDLADAGVFHSDATDGITCRILSNPASDKLNIDIYVDAVSSKGEVSIYNLNGALISNSSMSLAQGNNLISRDLTSLSSGSYICLLNIEGQKIALKFSVVR